jgi:hypothetical protein
MVVVLAIFGLMDTHKERRYAKRLWIWWTEKLMVVTLLRYEKIKSDCWIQISGS